MTCEEIGRYEDLYLDGEMAPEERVAMEAHLGTCEPCRRRLATWIGLRGVVRDRLREVRAPTSLRQSLDRRMGRNVSRSRRVLPLALAATAALVAWGTASWWRSDPGEAIPVEDSAVTAHLAMAGQEVQGDRTAVESFLRTRVPFPVRVPLPDGPEIRLLGARVTRIGPRPAVVYLYDAGGHRLSVTQYAPDREPLPERPRVGRRDGLTVVTYPDAGLLHTLVGDLPESAVTGIVPASWRP